MPFTRAKIGEFERQHQEETPAHKPNGRLWKGVSGQAQAKSLEWIPCGGEILNMEEFNLEKSSCLKEQALAIDKDGSLKDTDEFGNTSQTGTL